VGGGKKSRGGDSNTGKEERIMRPKGKNGDQKVKFPLDKPEESPLERHRNSGNRKKELRYGKGDDNGE